MEKAVVLIIALTCAGGERLLDLRGKLPSTLEQVDLVISVKPFYSRLYLYPLGAPNKFQQCCSNKPPSVLRLPVGEGRFCVRQSQPAMEWKIRVLSRPDVQL